MSYIARIATQWAGCSHEFEVEELPTQSDFLKVCSDEIWNSIISGCELFDAETDEIITEFAEE